MKFLPKLRVILALHSFQRKTFLKTAYRIYPPEKFVKCGYPHPHTCHPGPRLVGDPGSSNKS